MELITKIRQEIERRIKLYSITNEKEQWIVNTYWSVLSFLDTLQEQSVKDDEIDFEQELYNRFGMVKDFTLGMRIAQCFYELGKNAK